MNLPNTLTTNERLFLRKNEKSYLIFCENKRFTVGYESAKAFLKNKSHDFWSFEYGVTERGKIYKNRIKFVEYINALPESERFEVKTLEETSLFFTLYARKQNWSRTEIELNTVEVSLFKELVNNVVFHKLWSSYTLWSTSMKERFDTLPDSINKLQELIADRYPNTVILSLSELHKLWESVEWRIRSWHSDRLIGVRFGK